MRKSAMVFVGISGCLAVILGAFGAHFLSGKVDAGVLSAKDLHAYETAVHYQLFHTLAILGVFSIKDKYPLYNRTIGILFMLGILLFSGSIYLLSTGGVTNMNFRWLGPVTPLGGLCFITGWALLALSAFKQKEVTISK
ncbi:MAG TPA: DUF423 domain-containing protein [Bacteroidia bacterium]|nr:DUF423 domain-containing protein [Bacteroidia bacterium]